MNVKAVAFKIKSVLYFVLALQPAAVTDVNSMVDLK